MVSRGRSRVPRLLAGWLALQLLASLAAVVLLAPSTDARARPNAGAAAADVRAAPAPLPDPRSAREQAVRALLETRARAVVQRDRAAFLATVWRGAPDFLERQAALFDNLAGVPLGSWAYVLDGSSDRGPAPELDAKYGAGRWWAPDVVLTYAIADFDKEPTYAAQGLTFVQADGGWFLAADDELVGRGRRTTRALWDGGPVVSVRGTSTLALGHPGSQRLLRQLADGIDQAVPRVTQVWGPDWNQAVVVQVPDTQDEADRILGGSTDLTRIAAVATAELTDLSGNYRPVGDRVMVNPPNFAKLGPLGRQVVLTHETAHVASRAATGPDVPTWLVEGLADYIGYLDVDVPLATAARETQLAVRDGRVPDALPANAAFDGANPGLPLAYETSWLAVRLLVDTYGLQPALAFYRAVGASRGAGADAAVERAFAAELGTTTAAFTQAWREHLAGAFSSPSS